MVTASAVNRAPQPVGRHAGAAAAGLLFLAIGLAAWLAHGQVEQLLADLDNEALDQASRTLQELVARQREQLV